MNATDHTVVVLSGRKPVTARPGGSGAAGVLRADPAAVLAQIDHCLALWSETKPVGGPYRLRLAPDQPG